MNLKYLFQNIIGNEIHFEIQNSITEDDRRYFRYGAIPATGLGVYSLVLLFVIPIFIQSLRNWKQKLNRKATENVNEQRFRSSVNTSLGMVFITFNLLLMSVFRFLGDLFLVIMSFEIKQRESWILSVAFFFEFIGYGFFLALFGCVMFEWYLIIKTKLSMIEMKPFTIRMALGTLTWFLIAFPNALLALLRNLDPALPWVSAIGIVVGLGIPLLFLLGTAVVFGIILYRQARKNTKYLTDSNNLNVIVIVSAFVISLIVRISAVPLVVSVRTDDISFNLLYLCINVIPDSIFCPICLFMVGRSVFAGSKKAVKLPASPTATSNNEKSNDP
eukprot:gb/GECH01004175.1/.p1 GENE.gb/GECH01004175.1/~~gb/GECH01004175.1/.p1  ORF type:complete len:331 (+),score=58.97 gb/GECH01004175.1/:1-993(+)